MQSSCVPFGCTVFLIGEVHGWFNRNIRTSDELFIRKFATLRLPSDSLKLEEKEKKKELKLNNIPVNEPPVLCVFVCVVWLLT